jgi:3-oxoacyl-[acyl-carrier protein] reductase
LTIDLGISGRQALVCGASKGLGRACAVSLVRAGVSVTITGRNEESLEDAAREIQETTGRLVKWVAGDITTVQGQTAALDAVSEPDILVTNAGGPPAGNVLSFQPNDWRAAVDRNMIAPLSLIKAVIGPMCDRRFGRIVNITSASVKSPLNTMGLSVGARLGLTGAVAILARQVAHYNVAINNLLPGAFLTDRLRANLAHQAAESGSMSVEESLASVAKKIPAGRLGDPAEFGDVCAFLCSASAGYIVGQNVLIDGGNFNASVG